jgi:hydrogenase maturation protease
MNFNEFYDYLSNFNRVVIVGLGNLNRGDDGTGLYLLHKLQEKPKLDSILFIEAERTPENHLDEIVANHPELVIFVDVIRNLKQNTIQLLDATSIEQKGFTTHSYSITLIEQYLNNYNIKTRYLAIPVQEIGTGNHISPELKARVRKFLTN